MKFGIVNRRIQGSGVSPSLGQWTLGLVTLIALGSASCTSQPLYTSRNLSEGDQILLKRRWVIPTYRGQRELGDRGVEYSYPLLRENTLVFGNRTVGLVALYPSINQQRWVLPIPGGVLSPLAGDQDFVYFGGGDGFLYCVSLETGRVQWRHEIRSASVSRPTLSRGKVLVTTEDDAVMALDAQTGQWLWQYRRKSNLPASIRGASAPLVDGDQVLVGLSDGFLVALGFGDGALRWERKLHSSSKFVDVDAEPVLDQERVLIPAYDGALYALRRTNGEVLWRFDAGGAQKVVLDQERIYLSSSDGHVYGLEIASGREIWRFAVDRGVPSTAVVAGGFVLFGSTHQYLYAIESQTGRLRARFNSGWGSGFSGMPAYDPKTKSLYALSMSGNLYAFSVIDPSTRRTRRLGQTDPYR